MKTNYPNQTNSFLLENKTGFVVLLILFLLSSVGMFGQNQVKTIQPVKDSIEIKKVDCEIASLDSQIDFVNWFMGSKQSQLINEGSTNHTESTNSTKKQIISSGINPNRVLYRTFVKKVISKDNVIV